MRLLQAEEAEGEHYPPSQCPCLMASALLLHAGAIYRWSINHHMIYAMLCFPSLIGVYPTSYDPSSLRGYQFCIKYGCDRIVGLRICGNEKTPATIAVTELPLPSSIIIIINTFLSCTGSVCIIVLSIASQSVLVEHRVEVQYHVTRTVQRLGVIDCPQRLPSYPIPNCYVTASRLFLDIMMERTCGQEVSCPYTILYPPTPDVFGLGHFIFLAPIALINANSHHKVQWIEALYHLLKKR